MNSARSKILILISLYLAQFILTSCEAPRSTRTSSRGSTSSSAYNYDGSSGSLLNNNNNDDDDSDDSDDDDDTVSTITIPNGAESCDWSTNGTSGYTVGAAHLADDESTAQEGAYNICQNETYETTVYFQLKNAISDEQICLIPMFETGGNSTYLGEPRCFTPSVAGKIYTITLYKNRPGYTGYGITGVMMMRDKSYYYTSPYPTTYKIFSVDAYLYCANYLAAYNSDAYCQSFAAGAHYVYHSF